MWLLLLLVAVVCTPVAARKSDDESEQVLDAERVWMIHLHVSAKGWQMMQPTRTSRLASLLGVNREDLPATQPADSDSSADDEATEEDAEGQRLAPSPFGYEYAYVRATADFDDQRIENVGLRFKGNGSYASSVGLRRPFKLDFDRFVDEQEFHGLKQINIHNNAVDPSDLRETISYMTYRDAGVPSPRTAFAMVYLTIDGQVDRQYLGLYNLVEDVGKRFLKRHFKTSKGLLLKPEGVRNLAYLGEDWAEYRRYEPKTDADEKLARRFIEFTRFLHYADDETFASEIAAWLDVDGFLRFLAVTALQSNMDSFLTGNHNYYIYVHPDDQRIRFIPWDMHLSMGGSATAAAPDPAIHLSVDQPYRSPNRLIERVLAVGEYRHAYEGYLKQFARGCYHPDRLNAQIDAITQAVQKAKEAQMAAESEGSTTRPTTIPARPLRPMPDLKQFISGRVASVLGQLDGMREGYVPGQRPPTPAPPLPPPPRIIIPRPPRVVARRAAQKARPEAAVRSASRVRNASTTQPAVRTTPPRGDKPNRQSTTTGSPATTRPTAVAVTKPAVRPVPPAPKPRIRPAKATINPTVGLFLRSVDTDRDNRLRQDEMIDLVRLFYYAVGRESRILDEATIARGLDRMARLADPDWLATPSDCAAHASARNEVSPGQPWAQSIAKRADADEDGRMSLIEAVDAVQKWFVESDRDADRSLDPKELEESFLRLVPERAPTSR